MLTLIAYGIGKSTTSHLPAFFLFFFFFTKSGLLCSDRWSVKIMTYHKIVHCSFFTTVSDSCSYHFSFTATPFILYTFQWIFFFIQSCCRFYSHWACFVHSLTTSFNFINLSTQPTDAIFWVVSIFSLTAFFFIACSCAAIGRAVPLFNQIY